MTNRSAGFVDKILRQMSNYRAGSVIHSDWDLNSTLFKVDGVHDDGNLKISAEHDGKLSKGVISEGPLYLGGLKACDEDSCILNSANTFYGSDSTTTEIHLRPYMFRKTSPRKLLPILTVFFSLLSKSFFRGILLFVICVVLSLFLVFGAFPSSAFPFDTFGAGHLFILVTLCIGAYFSIDLAKYRSILEGFSLGMGQNCKEFVGYLCASVFDTGVIMKPTQRFIYSGEYPQIDVELQNTILLCSLTDCWFISQSIMYAGNMLFSDGCSPTKSIDDLPMPKILLDELRHSISSNSDIVTALTFMQSDRVTILMQHGAITDVIAGYLLDISRNIATSYAQVNFLLYGGSNVPRFMSIFFSILLWVYCAFLTFPLYQYFAVDYSLWVYYPVMFFLVILIMLGFDILFNVFANPFSMFQLISKTNHVPFEPIGVADTVADFIRVQFEILLKQQIQLSLKWTENKNSR